MNEQDIVEQVLSPKEQDAMNRFVAEMAELQSRKTGALFLLTQLYGIEADAVDYRDGKLLYIPRKK